VPKPSLTLLRDMTDERVLRALMDAGRLTRAELAVRSGLSKPTVADSVRRLEELGLVVDTGERTRGRGGVGSYFAVDADAGVALAISIAPEGIVAELVDAGGACRSHVVEELARPATAATVSRALTAAVRTAARGYDRSAVRLAVVSAADPVDRVTGALVQLPDAPFLIGELSPAQTLRPLVDGAVLVDNDVNWAARAERIARQSADAASLDDFVYLYLGEGLGCAVVADGEVRRGHGGLAGEIAHVLTTDVSGRAVPFTAVFEQLGLRHAGSAAIDVERLTAGVEGARGELMAAAIARAVGGVLAAAVALTDPRVAVLGGPWGTLQPVLDQIQHYSRSMPRPVAVERATVEREPALAGARGTAIDELRKEIIGRARGIPEGTELSAD
jgi:predicted NBD/HSP70 family sugar kinase